MSIYSKALSQLEPSDLSELLQERAVENTRLEFKRDEPNKEETLKKLTSFANTYGGLLVIGAAAGSKDGRIESLPGIKEIPGYRQKIVDWCFKECCPPIIVDVSDPIPAPNNSSSVCYVISVEESDVAPHFLNGRKGVWVRTNEFSARSEAALANENELRGLLNRRQSILDRRSEILARARKRFQAYLSTLPPELSPGNATGAVFELCLLPRFPARQVCRQEEIAGLLNRVRDRNYRGVGFPMLQNPSRMMSQHQSVIIRQPLDNISLLEANIWGMLYYATRLVEESHSAYGGPNLHGIHLYEFVGQLLKFLEHAMNLLGQMGLTGPILIETSLRGIRERQWYYAENYGSNLPPIPASRPPSGLDDEFALSTPTTVESLREKTDEVATELLRSIFFSVDWSQLVDNDEKLKQLIQEGRAFNGRSA